jgi:hypothetical protein
MSSRTELSPLPEEDRNAPQQERRREAQPRRQPLQTACKRLTTPSHSAVPVRHEPSPQERRRPASASRWMILRDLPETTEARSR